jgi:hypothetical protein
MNQWTITTYASTFWEECARKRAKTHVRRDTNQKRLLLKNALLSVKDNSLAQFLNSSYPKAWCHSKSTSSRATTELYTVYSIQFDYKQSQMTSMCKNTNSNWVWNGQISTENVDDIIIYIINIIIIISSTFSHSPWLLHEASFWSFHKVGLIFLPVLNMHTFCILIYTIYLLLVKTYNIMTMWGFITWTQMTSSTTNIIK